MSFYPRWFFGTRLGWLRQGWSSGNIIPIVCRETAAELLRVLGYPKFKLSTEDRAALLEDYLPFAEVAFLPDPPPQFGVDCRDADAIVFLQLALVAGADFLVSGDDDLIGIGRVGSVPIVSVETFRRALRL